MTGPWTVHVEWLPILGQVSPDRNFLHHPDQCCAEQSALSLACCRGSRYISVQGPDDVVTLEWDRYSNVARRYRAFLGVCGAEREPDGEICTGPLAARVYDVQVRCPRCGAWRGVNAPR